MSEAPCNDELASDPAWPALPSPARIFVYEHITGGGLCGRPLPASLAREGRAMLAALAADLAALPRVEVAVMVDARVGADGIAGHAIAVGSEAAARAERLRLAADCDGSVIIAPETDSVLETLSRESLEAGAALLGATPRGVRIAADKLETAARLEAAGVPCVPARAGSAADAGAIARDAVVVKPRHGAGSQGVRLVARGERIPHDAADGGGWIITPYFPGRAASVLAVVGRDGIEPFLPGEQRLSRDGRFDYLGGAAPLEDGARERASALALRALAALPGLRGFAGVDLILADPSSGEPDRVVEVNPRLTTSYAGLRRLAERNLAATWLGAWTGTGLVAPSWRGGLRVLWDAGGDVTIAVGKREARSGR